MRRKIGIITGVVLVGVLAASCGNSINQSTTTTLNNFNGVNSASVNSISGLSLSLSLDSITYKAGQDVYITVEEHNTLNTDTIVPASNNWALDYLEMGGCRTNGFCWNCSLSGLLYC